MPVPECRQDSFILKAVVKNSGFGLQKTGFALRKMEIVSVVLNSIFGKTIKEKMKKIIDEIDENQVIAAARSGK